MPYEGEYATGLTLAQLAGNPAVVEFEGEIRKSPEGVTPVLPTSLTPARPAQRLRWLIVFDGSTVTANVLNGYPGAEAALLNIASVVINLHKMRTLTPDPIPGPSQVRQLEDCQTLSAVLPGRNVIRPLGADTPRRFFRHVVHRELSGGTLIEGHETLLQTLQAITTAREPHPIRCPGQDCDETVKPGLDILTCTACQETIYPTDSLRSHERFEDYGSSEQAFTVVRMVVEHLSMLNVLRWMEKNDQWQLFNNVGLIMDGPLAIFGMAAWLKRYVQSEVERIHTKSIAQGGTGVLLIGLEKSGLFTAHMDLLDWSTQGGTRSRIPLSTTLVPDVQYIHQHIALRPPNAKPHGLDTYYGRTVMYKTHSGQHAVLTLPIVNALGHDRSCVTEDVYPRLGEALDLLDELGTYIYRDGFTPLIRAHAHAAIPLHRGTDILTSLFEDHR